MMETFEFLECSICSEEVIEFAAIFSVDKKFGDKSCRHNFCSACIKNYMEYNIKNKKPLSCPICREEFDGFIQNRTSNELLIKARNLSSASIFLKSENSNLNKEIDQIKKDREIEINQYKQKIKDLEDYKNKQIQESNNVKNRIQDMEQQIQELEQTRLVDMENNQLKFDGQQQQILSLTQSNREQTMLAQSYQQKNNDLIEQINSLYKQIEEFKQYIQSQDNTIAKIENEKRALQAQLSNIESINERKIGEQLSIGRSKDLQIAKLSESNQSLGQSLSKIQAECDHFKKLYQEIKEDSSSGFEKNKDLEGAIATLHIELSRSKSVIEALSMNKRTLEKELEETKLYQSNRGGGASFASTITSSPAIINTANKITNSSYNIINSGLGYIMGNTKSNIGDITKPYKSFKIEEKRGNKNSQIHKVSIGNGSGNFIIKLVPLSYSNGGGGNNYLKLTSFYNSFYTGTLSDQEILSFRESMLLYKLNHNNILKLEAMTKDESTGKIYSVLSPFVPLDLEFILAENKPNNHFKISPTTLTFPNIKYILYQLISVVHYLHSQDLVHRDIKPTSVLLFDDNQIKLCSFGNASSVFTSFANSISPPTYNNNPSSFGYLSPEYICSVLDKESQTKQLLKQIDWKAFDMWSIGCIFLEMIFKFNIFNNQISNNNNNDVNNNNNNNNNKSQQQEQYYNVLNNITTFKESAPKNGNLYFKENHNLIIKANVEKNFLSAKLPSEAYNLLCSLLSFNPSIRIKANHAVFHNFFKDEPYFVCDSSSVSPNKHQDLSSSLTDRNIRQFLKEKCSSIVQV